MPSPSTVALVFVSCIVVYAVLLGAVKLVAWVKKRRQVAKESAQRRAGNGVNSVATANQGASSPPKQMRAAYSKQQTTKKVVNVESVSQVFKGKHRNR